MNRNYFSISGKSKGKEVVIIAGIHGNEKCGVKAFERVAREVRLDSGIAHFIIGNPKALEQNKRFIDVNLNRLFRDDRDLSEKERASYEYQRAKEIALYLNLSDASLDLHSSASESTKPFAICEAHSFAVAQNLPVQIISSGWDLLEPGGTDYFMNKQGKIGICIECGNHNDPKAEEIAYNSIVGFLKSLGLLSGLGECVTNQKYIKVDSIYKTKVDFKPQRTFGDFESVKKNEYVGLDGSERIYARYNGYVIFCRERERSNEEAFLFAKDKD